MRIAVLGNAQSAHTARWAKAYADRGHEVFLLSIRPTHLEGVNTIVFRVGKSDPGGWLQTLLSYAVFLVRVRRRIGEISPDVIHAHYSVTHGVVALAAGLHPVVLSVWGSDVVGDRGPVRGILRLINRFVLTRVDLITATSRFMIPIVQELAGRSVRVEHVPFGVDPVAFPLRPTPECSDGFRIGFVKHLKQKYGPSVLIEALVRVRSAYPQATLVMVGHGALLPALMEQARALGIDDSVEFLGPVPHAEVPRLMRTFDVLVNPSVVAESFGVVLLEAMSSGVPVVATDVGGVAEVVRGGENGLLVQPSDADALASAILTILQDAALRRRFVEEGRRTVTDVYRWSDNIDRMLALLTASRGRTAVQRRMPLLARIANRLDPGSGSNWLTKVLRRFGADMWFAIRNAVRGSRVALTVDCYRMTVDLTDRAVARHLYWHRAYESDSLRVLLSYARAGSTAIDVGANLGVYTLPLATAVGSDGQVLAIEPEHRNLALLRRNLQQNRIENVTVVEAAAGSTPGTATLQIDAANFGGHHLISSDSQDGAVVPVVRIDDLLTARDVAVVKIDVEGREVDVLDGMTETISLNRPIVQFEVNRLALEKAGVGVAALVNHRSLSGYVLHRVIAGKPVPTTRDALIAEATTRHFNVVAIAENSCG